MIRDQSRQSEKPGVGGETEERRGGQSQRGGERSDYELSGPSHAAGLTEHIVSEYKYTLHSCPLIWHRGFPPWCSTTNVPLHFCVPNRKSVKDMSLPTQVNHSHKKKKRRRKLHLSALLSNMLIFYLHSLVPCVV